MGKLFKDDTLYNNTEPVNATETRELVKAIRENPKKYLSIKLHVFATRALRWLSSCFRRFAVGVHAVAQDVQLALFELDAQLDQRRGQRRC